jgi:Domain of unknown function (DUF6285)
MAQRRGIPSSAELVQAVREFLEAEVSPATDGRLRFHVRVAANVLAMIERELSLGPQASVRHAERLRVLGFADDAALCAAIRSGSLDDRFDEVRSATRASVVEKLRISNPRHLLASDRQEL